MSLKSKAYKNFAKQEKTIRSKKKKKLTFYRIPLAKRKMWKAQLLRAFTQKMLYIKKSQDALISPR